MCGLRTTGGGLVPDEERRGDAEGAPSPTEAERAHRLRLEQAGQMLAGVVHEINNPLAVIHGYAQLLLEQATDEQQREDLGAILRETRRLSTLVDDMLSFTRRGTGEVESIDVGRTISAAVNLAAHGMRQARVSVAAVLPPMALTARGHDGTCVQVLLNLLENARQSLQQSDVHPREIGITAERTASGSVEVRVRNNGPPIDEALVEEIFKPFFTTKPAGVGTGLGLALCRSLLERFGGSIALASRGGPEGVVFVVTLPGLSDEA